MTKKDYLIIADVLNAYYENSLNINDEKLSSLIVDITTSLSTQFSANIPRFNLKKFEKAVFGTELCASGHPQDDDGRCKCTNKDGK